MSMTGANFRPAKRKPRGGAFRSDLHKALRGPWRLADKAPAQPLGVPCWRRVHAPTLGYHQMAYQGTPLAGLIHGAQRFPYLAHALAANSSTAASCWRS